MIILILCFFFWFNSCSHTSPIEQDPTAESQFIRFYHGPLNHLAAVRTGHCPMYPSCSAYSAEAFSKYGFIQGYIMTLDRLLRCGRDELTIASRYQKNGHLKAFDPVWMNDLKKNLMNKKEILDEKM